MPETPYAIPCPISKTENGTFVVLVLVMEIVLHEKGFVSTVIAALLNVKISRVIRLVLRKHSNGINAWWYITS